MDTYFVEKLDESYVNAKSNGGCWEDGRREAPPNSSMMAACDWRSGYLDQGRRVHLFDGCDYTRLHHSSDGWIEMREVPRYGATSLHIRKNGGGYSDY